MKKIIFTLTICAVAISSFGGERVEQERERWAVKNERKAAQQERINMGYRQATVKRITRLYAPFRPSKSAIQADDLTRLELTYPLAFARYKSLEEFSYFGFKKYDVEIGKLSLEDFLKEYNDYLLIYQN